MGSSRAETAHKPPDPAPLSNAPGPLQPPSGESVGRASKENQELDPRVRRTRKMLHDALAKLLKEKDFEKISIGDIAEESTLNRATFYDHYADKFELLQCMVGSQFEELIAKRNIRFNGCEGAIKNLALAACYYLSETVKPGADGLRQASAPMENAIVAVLRRSILDGFSQHQIKRGTPVEIVSSSIAWAIYGSAKEWVQSSKRMPVSKMAETIERIVKPILVSFSAEG